MNETKIQREITNYLLTQGWLVLRLNSLRAGRLTSYIVYPKAITTGMPDLLAIKASTCLWIEVKATNGRTSTAQRNAHTLLTFFNIPHLTARSVEDVKEHIYANKFHSPRSN